jgi:nucleoside-diphosphate-sugar epimerase
VVLSEHAAVKFFDYDIVGGIPNARLAHERGFFVGNTRATSPRRLTISIAPWRGLDDERPGDGRRGYIGAILVPALLERGFNVTVVDNFMYGQDRPGRGLLPLELLPGRGDVRSLDTMRPLLKDADFIVPLAALVGAPLCDRDPLAATSTNKQAIIDMLEHISPNQPVILPITNSGYGVGEAGKYCTEETPIRPVSLYGRDKVEVERTLLDRHPASVSLRLATVFGMSPRMRLDLLVNDFTYRAYTDRFIVLFESHFKRNFLHVRDVARAFLHTIDNFDVMKRQIYNVGLSDANLSKLELCQRFRSMCRVRHPRVECRKRSRQARLHRLEREDRANRLQAGVLA